MIQLIFLSVRGTLPVLGGMMACRLEINFEFLIFCLWIKRVSLGDEPRQHARFEHPLQLLIKGNDSLAYICTNLSELLVSITLLSFAFYFSEIIKTNIMLMNITRYVLYLIKNINFNVVFNANGKPFLKAIQSIYNCFSLF